MHEIEQTITQWMTESTPIWMATVTKTWGSAPRQAGSHLAFRDDLAMVGSVSGGCVENAVIEAGLSSAVPQYLHYGISNDDSWEVGLTCGGELSVYVEPFDSAWWNALAQRMDDGLPTVSITAITGTNVGEKALFGLIGCEDENVPV